MAVTPSPKPNTETTDHPEFGALTEYVVTVNAVTYRTGKDEVRRFDQGSRLRLFENEPRTREMLRNKSIAVRPKNGEKLVRSTPLMVFAAMGAADDPATPPVQDVQPLRQSGGRASKGAVISTDE